jgi:CBS domain containing-hemolysin-like protein
MITFLHIVLGELAPKSLAIRKPIPTTLWISRPLTLFHSAFKPAIWFLNGAANFILKRAFRIDPVAEMELVHSEEELRLLLAESGKAREISSRGSAISLRALELTRLVARDVMTPRREVVFLEVELPFSENLARAKQSRHTRFPICRQHLDRAFGLIHIKDMIGLIDEPQPDLNVIKRELLSVPEMISLEKLLELFQSRHAHLALVLDEYGGAVGIVTLDNVVEELVGDIHDEFDTDEPPMHRSSATQFTIKGRLSLHEVRELTGLDLESSDVSTLGGYVTSLLGHLPQVGESVRIADYLVTVINTDGRRLRQLRFEKIGDPKD